MRVGIFAALSVVGLSCASYQRDPSACVTGYGEVTYSGSAPRTYFHDIYQRKCGGVDTWEVSIRQDGEAPGVGPGNAYIGRAPDGEGFRVRASWTDSGLVIVPDSILVALKKDTLVRGIRVFYAPKSWRLRPRPVR